MLDVTQPKVHMGMITGGEARELRSEIRDIERVTSRERHVRQIRVREQWGRNCGLRQANPQLAHACLAEWIEEELDREHPARFASRCGLRHPRPRSDR